MKNSQWLIILFLPLLLLNCKKKAGDELSLEDMLKQQEQYYQSLPDWEKLRYKAKNQALLQYGLKAKIKDLEEKRVDRPAGGWNPNITEINVWVKIYKFDGEGRITKFEYDETSNNTSVRVEDSIVTLFGDTIIGINMTKDNGNIVRNTEFKYLPSGNFSIVTYREMQKLDVNGAIQTTYERKDVIYTYDEKDKIINKRWITYRPSEVGYNNIEYFQSIDTTFSNKGYPEESHEVTYQYGITPNDTLKIIRKEFGYDNKDQLITVTIDDVTQDYVLTPTQVNTMKTLTTTKALTPQGKVEYKNYDNRGNWIEKWVYENGFIPNDPTYKIRRTKIQYHD